MRTSDTAPIAVPPFCEHRSGTFKLDLLGASSFPPTDIGAHEESPHVVAVQAHGNISQDRVKSLDLVSAGGFLHNSPVFTQTPEVEGLSHRGQNDERSLATARG